MKRINKNITPFLSIVFLIITTVMVIIRRYKLGFPMEDIDGYILKYNHFLEKGYYFSVAEGTTILYYLNIVFFQKILKLSVVNAFLVTNIFSQLLMALIGSSIIYNIKNIKNKNIILFSVIYYCLLWINDEQFGLSRNDLFFGVFALLLYRVFYLKGIKHKEIIIGIIVGLMLSIRLITVLLIPSIVIYFIIRSCEIKKSITSLFIKFLIPLLLTLLCLHYPSIIENKKLSFYNKNKLINNKGYDWSDINTLATLRMFDEGKVQIIRKDMYWHWNKSKVDLYKKKYGINRSPNNFISFFKKYPTYYLKLVSLNIFNVLVYFFRKYALLIILPLVMFYRDRFKISVYNSSFILFLTSLSALIIVLYSVIELRWLITMEFLMYYSIVLSYLKLKNEWKYTELITASSLFILILFNIKTILSYIIL